MLTALHQAWQLCQPTSTHTHAKIYTDTHINVGTHHHALALHHVSCAQSSKPSLSHTPWVSNIDYTVVSSNPRNGKDSMSNHFYELTFTQFSHQITKKLCERGDHRTRYDTTGWAKHNAARAMLPSALGLQKQSKN